ncbi:MAG: UDP-N-acetylmuramoyl-L-alanyl-D-glutamate--2,6-diaminopimelate ligase, partial [Verrucomicrobiales bacterium]|nr:UDP-N-acetylmuramoyl-L-alanyl-D-glutamate--2,6-diaminopimelate ligase [Verrucomicrobiales bacterium]
LGTVQYFDGVEVGECGRTTPESRDLQELLGAMRDNGCRGAVMEVSSHALVQDRVKSVRFEVGVFTNLSQDHLDYHRGIEAYYEAKALLFEQMAASSGRRGKAVVNIDDAYGRRLVKRFGERLDLVTYGMGLKADFRALDVRCDFDGTRFKLEAKGREFLVRLPLIGKFNVYNALAAITTGNAMGVNLRESLGYLLDSPQVPGRLESVAGKKPFRVFVDYAHTPDALENVLETLRDLEPNRLITVFGCGGERDVTKRPLMGKVAERLSDVCIVTSDNPRDEDPNKILKDITTGMRLERHAVIVDRAEAIRVAIGGAKGGDIVLVAGKGHETYQEIGGKREDFDDRKHAEWALKDWVNPHMKRADGEEEA